MAATENDPSQPARRLRPYDFARSDRLTKSRRPSASPDGRSALRPSVRPAWPAILKTGAPMLINPSLAMPEASVIQKLRMNQLLYRTIRIPESLAPQATRRGAHGFEIVAQAF
jgi:hypothetical protein